MERRDWSDVWSNFDGRRKAKANDGADDVVAPEPDMFGDQSGIAAE